MRIHTRFMPEPGCGLTFRKPSDRDLLRRMIQQEEYRKGKLLPNEVELSKELNISRNTLRQAINRLVFEGLLIRKKGYGTTVAPQNVMSNARNWMSFSQEMHAQGMVVQNFELHISRKTPPAEASEFLNAPEGARLLCLERLRGRPNLPFVYFISYFNPAIPMTGEEDMALPLYENLRKNYGIVVKTSREMVYARSANAELAEKLDITAVEAVLPRRPGYDARHRAGCTVRNKAVSGWFPRRGRTYHAVCPHPSGAEAFDLPVPNAAACVRATRGTGRIHRSERADGRITRPTRARLVVHCRGNQLLRRRLGAGIAFRSSDLPAGVVQWLLLDAAGNALPERRCSMRARTECMSRCGRRIPLRDAGSVRISRSA